MNFGRLDAWGKSIPTEHGQLNVYIQSVGDLRQRFVSSFQANWCFCFAAGGTRSYIGEGDFIFYRSRCFTRLHKLKDKQMVAVKEENCWVLLLLLFGINICETMPLGSSLISFV